MYKLYKYSCMLLFILIVFAVGNAGAEVRREASWVQPLEAPGLKNFYQVSPWLYRSEQPQREGFITAEKMGIKTILNLRSMHSDKNETAGLRLNLVEVPIVTWSFDHEEIVRPLRVLAGAPRPILVHCQHGADRTGLIIALYRVVFEGWSKEAATREMLEGGYGFHAIWVNITSYLDKVDVEKLKAQVLADQ